ncbi:hypothetical protein JFU58_10125 [Pseudomonas sp. TH34]|uniref:hypothetical protein n=1 Tax=Pseudomonas sp. TH34 TaxID=2796399 RepID=UPI0019146D45|nr:hypothetical protein [Pseudomonas sp. TH34]MBK5408895.1 hypothetical protein [Pseudomonas sp. TH34]
MRLKSIYLESKMIIKLVSYVPLSVFVALISCEAHAYALKLDDISNSYSSCYFQDNGNGTSTLSTVIDYKTATGHTGGTTFKTRGILLYSYDKNGSAANSTPVKFVTMDGVASSNIMVGSGYYMYFVTPSTTLPWSISAPVAVSVKLTVSNSSIAAWPALSIRAGNYTMGDDVGEIKGAAYITRDRDNGGNCIVITDPGKPPPLDINITVSAPDWDVGDLQQGESDTTLNRTDQQLCFSYNAGDVLNEKFIISASNANGVLNNRYQLRHLSDTSQTVPYSLTLDSGNTRLQLPNNSTAIPLDGGNRTCFVPTFRTEVGKTVKEGDYSDVLTFTLTTKS